MLSHIKLPRLKDKLEGKELVKSEPKKSKKAVAAVKSLVKNVLAKKK